MSICKAVGRKDCAEIRYACLRNNMDFLRYAFQTHADNMNMTTDDSSDVTDSHNACLAKIRAWMKVNIDWKKHCSAELIDDVEVSTATSIDESGRHVRKGDNPLILFNNPALAIEFDQIKILKHLVEKVGIDINRTQWSGYYLTPNRNLHLLLLASSVASQYDGTFACFDYLASRRELDPFAIVITTPRLAEIPLWITAYEIDEFDVKCFEAIIRHGEFDTNTTTNLNGHSLLPLHIALVLSIHDVRGGFPVREKIRKVKLLLKHGADPELEHGGMRSPLEMARHGLGEFERGSDEREVYREFITIMEEHVANT